MNLDVLFEDPHIIVCIKPSGIASQPDPSNDTDMTHVIHQYLKESPRDYETLDVIHRLDRPVQGVMVYSKTKHATKRLSEQIRQHNFYKEYIAVTNGVPDQSSGTLTHYLKRIPSINYSKVVKENHKNGKKAVLEYSVTNQIQHSTEGLLGLWQIKLITGRHHQIRVQLSQEGYPLWGDTKYNPRYRKKTKWHQIALFASGLNFTHPVSKENLSFTYYPKDQYPFNLFNV